MTLGRAELPPAVGATRRTATFRRTPLLLYLTPDGFVFVVPLLSPRASAVHDGLNSAHPSRGQRRGLGGGVRDALAYGDAAANATWRGACLAVRAERASGDSRLRWVAPSGASLARSGRHASSGRYYTRLAAAHHWHETSTSDAQRVLSGATERFRDPQWWPSCGPRGPGWRRRGRRARRTRYPWRRSDTCRPERTCTCLLLECRRDASGWRLTSTAPSIRLPQIRLHTCARPGTHVSNAARP